MMWSTILSVTALLWLEFILLYITSFKLIANRMIMHTFHQHDIVYSLLELNELSLHKPIIMHVHISNINKPIILH